MECNREVQYVNKEVFYCCYQEIRHLLDNSTLLEYLRQYGVLNDPVDEEELVSPYYQLEDRFSVLVNLIEKQGDNGYMILYMCIHESSTKSLRHKDAVSILGLTGK